MNNMEAEEGGYDEFGGELFEEIVFDSLIDAGLHERIAQYLARLIATTEPQERTIEQQRYVAHIYQQLTANLEPGKISPAARWLRV